MIAPPRKTASSTLGASEPGAVEALPRVRAASVLDGSGAGRPASLGVQVWNLALEWWRPVVLALLCIEAPLIVLNRFELPFGVSFGFRSFARNIALVMIIGVAIGARGMPRFRSSLLVPMVVFFAMMAVSVAANGWLWSDAHSVGVMVGLFVGARSLAESKDGRVWLYHWLGAVAVTTVLVEIALNPAILQFREALRDTMVTAHPNTVGAFFALVTPVLIGSIDDASARRMAPFYGLSAVVGAAMTFSRLSLAGVFLGVAAIFLATWLRRHPVRLTVLGAVSVVGVAALHGYLSLGRSEADWQRLRIIHASLTLFSENWLSGVGFGVANLERVFPQRYADIYGTRIWLYHSHNMYVDILTGTGILGALASGWLFVRLVSIARRALTASRENPRLRRAAGGFAAAVVVFFLIGMGDMPWYHARLLFPLAILWGLMEGWTRSAEADLQERAATAPRT